MLVCDVQPCFVVFRAFTGFKVPPPPLGSWHSPGVWVRKHYCVDRPPGFEFTCPTAGGIAGFVGNPGGSCTAITYIVCTPTHVFICVEIIMVCFPWVVLDFRRLTSCAGSLAGRYGQASGQAVEL